MRQRDLGILFVSALAAFLALQETDDFNARRRFSVDIDPAHYKNHHTPAENERIPRPIVTDIDGDGQNELIVVTRDPKIRIYDTTTTFMSEGKSQKDHHTQLLLQAESTLLSKAKIRAARQPVAFTTGYLSPEDKHQVIAVLTHDWTVLCFDHALKLLWEAHPVKKKHLDMFHKEAAIHISSTTVRSKDKGLVVVGGAMELTHYERFYTRAAKVTSKTHKKHSAVRQKKRQERRQKQIRKHLVKAILRGAHKGDREKLVDEAARREEHTEEKKETEIQAMRHFSYYALDGRTGSMRWKQESGDWSLSEKENKMPQHNYKLDLHAETKHAGEVDWRQYRVSMLKALPHSWQSFHDSSFGVAHFSKRTRASKDDDKAREDAFHAREVGLGLDKLPIPNSKTDMAPQVNAERDASARSLPNVVVAHLMQGIEVLHLYTGRTLCQLALPPHTVNADINHDGAVDRVEAVITSDGEQAKRGGDNEGDEEMAEGRQCYAWVTTGTPPTHALFNRSICSPSLMGGAMHAMLAQMQQQIKTASMKGDGDEDGVEEAQLHAAMPALVQRDFRRDGVERGHALHDIVFAISDGTVTSFGPSGTVNWMKHTEAYWTQPALVSEVENSIRSAREFERHMIEVECHPEVVSFPLRSKDNEHAMLIIGMSHAVVLGHDGTKLTTFALPDVPLGPAIVADFDSDGFNDVVITTRTGYHGFTVSTQSTNRLLLFLLGSLLCGLALVLMSSVVGSTGVVAPADQRRGFRGTLARTKKERATD